MNIQPLHSWDLTPKEAVALQRQLADQVRQEPLLNHYDLVAGADVSFSRFSNTLYAGVVIFRLSDGMVIEKQGTVREEKFPYIPGLLSFRETPALLDVFAMIQSEPDVVMLDAHGFSHPRRFGLACHVGLWLDRPCLGCAKSRLVGEFKEPGKKAGARSPLLDKDEVIGTMLRTKTGIKPVFISVGHKINLDDAAKVALACSRGYRIPEPTRQAHLYVNSLRRKSIY